ncbi:hypothetical protein ACFL2V_15065 [Pseudomonadota bacterium]
MPIVQAVLPVYRTDFPYQFTEQPPLEEEVRLKFFERFFALAREHGPIDFPFLTLRNFSPGKLQALVVTDNTPNGIGQTFDDTFDGVTGFLDQLVMYIAGMDPAVPKPITAIVEFGNGLNTSGLYDFLIQKGVPVEIYDIKKQ